MNFTFHKTVKDKQSSEIIKNFQANFGSTNCDNIRRFGDNQLIVENNFFRLKSNQNLWVGIDKASLTIKDTINQNEKKIHYKINFTKFLLISFGSILLFFLFFIGDFTDSTTRPPLILYIFVPVVLLINFIILLIRHYSLFIRTIKRGSIYLGGYDWEKILKNKTDNELKVIIAGESHLSKSVGELAKKELDKRNNKKATTHI
ncbi:MAG: hypothetical protein DRI94_03380 [Bacteroidetes bacterium]|nr:MAG: hypothetical protein DRI94_03380 [Bacteroidota bacterium]